jgi:hypothetical protein
MENILEGMNIGLNTAVTSNDVISDIKTSILSNRPVVLWVDSFYESIREDTYLNIHWLHTLLVYGFNEKRQVINIIEHDGMDNLTYDHREIGYADVKKSFEGYLNIFQEQWGFPGFYEYFSKIDFLDENANENNTKNLYSLYTQNINKNKDLLISRIDCIKAFADDYESIVSNKLTLDEEVDTIINNINAIVNSKLVEKYLISYVFNNHDIFIEIADLINKVIEYWINIRAILARYKYSLVYKPESLKLSVQQLIQIYNYEQSYYKKLLMFIS